MSRSNARNASNIDAQYCQEVEAGKRGVPLSGLLQANPGMTLKPAPATSGTKKRQLKAIESAPTLTAAQQLEEEEKNKNRGNYRCGRCNLPKKGHICPYQPVLKPRERTQATQQVDAEVQVEIDPEMTVAALGALDEQGLPESYLPVHSKIRRISTVPT